MTHSYEVRVQCTGKAIGKGNFSTFEVDTKVFSTLQEVKDYLKEYYGKAKRIKMYRDGHTVNGKAPSWHAGYIYHFRDRDYSHNEPEYIREDWVEVFEVKRKSVIIN